MKHENLKPYLLCTDKDKRGVFFGYCDPKDIEKLEDGGTIDHIYDVRMVVRWKVKGLLTLCNSGPSSECRISEASPHGKIFGVICVLDVTPEAEKEFLKGHWGKND